MLVTVAISLLVNVALASALRVYMHPASAASLLPSLSADQARIIVSHQLGLDGFDLLEDIRSDPQLKNFILSEPFGGAFVGTGPRKALLLSVNEDVVEAILPSSLKRTFSLPTIPSSSDWIASTVDSFVRRAEHVYTNVFSISDSSPPPPVPRLLDIFSLDPTSSAVEAFLSETAQLVNFVESDDDTDMFGGFSLNGISALRSEGVETEAYTLAVRITRQLLVAALEQERFALVLLSHHLPPTISPRQQPPDQSPLPPNTPTLAPQLPFSSLSSCFPSLDACTNTTNSCSGRGACQQTSKPSLQGRTCFVCACNATRDASGRTQVWVGEACERRDISAPFTLLLGTSIGIIILLASSVYLLSGIGSQKLPPTLTASAGAHVVKSD